MSSESTDTRETTIKTLVLKITSVSEGLLTIFNTYFGADRYVSNTLKDMYDGYGDDEKPDLSVFDLTTMLRHSTLPEEEWITDGHCINKSLVHHAVTKFKQNYEECEARRKKYESKNKDKETYDENKHKLRHKSKKDDKQSFCLTNDGNKKQIKITEEGYISLNFTKKLGRHTIITEKPINIDSKDINYVCIKKVCNKLTLHINYDKQVRKPMFKLGSKLAIDLGSANPIVTFDGETHKRYDIPKQVYNADKNINNLKSWLEGCMPNSNRYNELKDRLQKNFDRRTNCRVDFQRKFVREHIDTYETIVIDLMPDHYRDGSDDEKTKVGKAINHKYGLLCHAHLTMLFDQASLETGNKIRYLKFEATTKTCSNCGCENEYLEPEQRVFECSECGHTEDRDYNASRNIYRWKIDENRLRDRRGRFIRKSKNTKTKTKLPSNPYSCTCPTGIKNTI